MTFYINCFGQDKQDSLFFPFQKKEKKPNPHSAEGVNILLRVSVCELETQILLAGNLGFIEKGKFGSVKKDIVEIERMLKALIKSLENKHLNP